MSLALRILLPAYFILYFGIAMVGRSVVVARRTGKNPFALPNDDTTCGLVGRYFGTSLVAIFAYTIVYALAPVWYGYFLPIGWLEKSAVVYTGLAFLAVSLVWTVVAQMHMKNSWRIGIDTKTKTELITGGLFSISRNPVFFGMLLALAGLFLATPNALTLLFLVLVYVIIQVQIRLEEEFLTREHGQAYLEYKQRARRLI